MMEVGRKARMMKMTELVSDGRGGLGEEVGGDEGGSNDDEGEVEVERASKSTS